MSPSAQRIAILEAIGWKLWPIIGFTPPGTEPPFLLGGYPLAPDPLKDLNAMNEAEKTLTPKQSELYCELVHDVVGIPAAFTSTSRGAYLVCHAPAAIRAEAFLKAIGKWQDTPPTEKTI
jgi:hypothetical protein